MPRSSGTPRLSLCEKVFVRHAAVNGKVNRRDVTQDTVYAAITAANDGDGSTATYDKYDAGRNIVKFCMYKKSNPNFWVPNVFGTKVIRAAVTAEELSAYVEHLNEVEETTIPRNFNETLTGAAMPSDNPLWYLNTSDAAVVRVCETVIRHFLDFQTDDEVSAALRKLKNDPNRKLFSSVSYIKYPAGQLCGIDLHQDVQSVFFSCVLIIQDTTQGRLHIENVDLPETFYAGDVIFMDPRVWHRIPHCVREGDRKVSVFNV